MNKLTEGLPAPPFEGINQNGKKISLKELKDKKVILYFYPKDNTPGCTAEACNLRDNYNILKEKGFKIIGVSPDDEKSHQKFIEKHNLPFDLVVDIDKKIATAYGVWGEKKMHGKTYMGIHRSTFMINEDGNIEKIFKKVDTKRHAEQILRDLKI